MNLPCTMKSPPMVSTKLRNRVLFVAGAHYPVARDHRDDDGRSRSHPAARGAPPDHPVGLPVLGLRTQRTLPLRGTAPIDDELGARGTDVHAARQSSTRLDSWSAEGRGFPRRRRIVAAANFLEHVPPHAAAWIRHRPRRGGDTRIHGQEKPSVHHRQRWVPGLLVEVRRRNGISRVGGGGAEEGLLLAG